MRWVVPLLLIGCAPQINSAHAMAVDAAKGNPVQMRNWYGGKFVVAGTILAVDEFSSITSKTSIGAVPVGAAVVGVAETTQGVTHHPVLALEARNLAPVVAILRASQVKHASDLVPGKKVYLKCRLLSGKAEAVVVQDCSVWK